MMQPFKRARFTACIFLVLCLLVFTTVPRLHRLLMVSLTQAHGTTCNARAWGDGHEILDHTGRGVYILVENRQSDAGLPGKRIKQKGHAHGCA